MNEPAGSRRESERRRAAVAVLLGVSVSGVALWFALRRVDADAVADSLAQAHAGPLLLTLGTSALAYLAMGLRSKVLFAPLAEFRLADHVRGHLVAFAGNALLPLRIGEVMRIDFLARTAAIRHGSCVGGLLVERLLDLAFMLACVLAGVLLTTSAVGPTGGAIGLSLALAAGGVALFAAARHPAAAKRRIEAVCARLGPRIAGRISAPAAAFVEGLAALASTRRVAAVAALTVLRWTIAFVTIRLWLSAFDLELPWYAPVVLLAALAFGTALPAAVAFVGTFHAALAGGLVLLGVDESRALSTAIAAHAMATLPWLAIGLLVVLVETGRGRIGGRRVVYAPGRGAQASDRPGLR